MPERIGRLYRRALSLLLSAALLFSSLPAYAADMSVRLDFSDPSTTVPVGTEITVWVKGTNAAVVGLMVVPPGSKEQKLEGDTHVVTFSQPGMYVLVGYCADRPDESDPGIQREKTPFHIVTVVGDAPEEEDPEELRGTLTIEAFTRPEWVPLRNAELRWNELLMWVDLANQSIPEGTRLQVDLYYGHESRTLLECEVGTDTNWRIEGTDIARALMSGGRGEPEYGRYAMSAAATIYTADGQKISAAEPFVMGWYSPEMLYVNQFFDDRWQYGKSNMGERLAKWLDMSERKDDRSSSGYLMLEQEILFREEWWNKAGQNYVKWAQKALATVSSLGLNLAVEWIGNVSYEEKFGEAGKKALPYYNMLASVYNSYVQTLLTDIQEISRGAYIEEQIRENTTLLAIQAQMDASDAIGDAAGALEAKDTAVDFVCLFAQPYDQSSYYTLSHYSRDTGVVHNIELTEVKWVPYPDGSGSRLSFSWTENGVNYHDEITYFVDRALTGDRIVLDTSKVTGADMSAYDLNDIMYDEMVKTYGPALSVRGNGEEYNVLLPQTTINTYSDPYGNRKIVVDGEEIDFTPEKIRELGLVDGLSDADRQAYDKYLQRLDAAEALDSVQKLVGVVSYGADLYNVITATKYHSRVQQAYFNTYSQVSAEYMNMLFNWYEELENSDAEDAAYIRAAVLALATDIYYSCDESLSAIIKAENVLMYTVEDWTNLFFDTIEFVCDIPEIVAAAKNYKLIFEQSKVAINGAVNWVKTAVSNIGKTAATSAASAGSASTAASAAGTAAKGSMSVASTVAISMLAISVGSVVYDMLTAAYIGHIDAIYSVYNTKQTLKETIDKTLWDYAGDPTHQRAVDIIESLYLMKELKLKGENLIISYYLTDMYKDFDLKGVREQMILMNEIIAMTSDYRLLGRGHIKRVYVVYENYIAGTRDQLKDAGYEIDGIGGIGGGDDYILDSRVVGMYLADNTPFTFQGVNLEKIPSAVFEGSKTKDSREKADTFDIREVDWLKDTNTFADNWQANMPRSLGERHFVKTMWAYSNHGLDLLLTKEEYDRYDIGEGKVNELLKNNNDATGDELGFWDFQGKEDWQNQQRIVWSYVTRKYIESLPMFDRTQTSEKE